MTKDLEYTSYIMNVVYNVEDQFILRNLTVEGMKDFINTDKNPAIKRPSGLKLVYAKHAPETGMTGVAFQDEKTGQILIGYAGTNNTTNMLKDWETNIVEVGLGQGRHYQSAFPIPA